VSAADLVALVCCDLGSIVRGRSVLASELGAHLDAGVGWVPANHSLTPLGPLAEVTPFGSTGDLRLLPDPDTHIRVEARPHGSDSRRWGSDLHPQGSDLRAHDSALELVLCDIVETDGRPWECCPRRFLRDALGDLAELGIRLEASFEHEFQLQLQAPPALPFSLEEQRRAEPFAGEVMGALIEAGVQPERFFAEFAAHQFEIPVEATDALAAADRSVVLKEVVREVARREGLRASFAPLLDPGEPGNGVHIHFNLLDAASGAPLLHDAARSACLSELGGSFAAGVLLHAGALSALCAPSPASGARLVPHRWSAGAVCLGQRNREALLRIPSQVTLAGAAAAGQLHLEYRGADATANPYLALGAIVRAGIDGVRAELPAPPILDRDPAQLDPTESERYGVGALPTSLEVSLRALAEDATARAWLSPQLYDAYVGIKRAELQAVADLDLGEVCRRYAAIY
jgi:glutamine synthetase